jgi:glutamate--cysteine ligase
LLQDSPKHTGNEVQINNANQLAVAHQGRKPGLALQQNTTQIPLQVWANQILQAMQPVCAVLDADNPDRPYTQALALQQSLVDNPDLTPSARILADMHATGQCFSTYALSKSAAHQQYFKQQPLDEATTLDFDQMAAVSLTKQKTIEANDNSSFDDYLAHYFAQH